MIDHEATSNPEFEQRESEVLSLIQRRVELRTQLAAASFELCKASELYNHLIADIVAVDEQIRNAEGRDLIRQIVTIGDLDRSA